uniref:Capsid protein n=1 Tax=Betatorquevirus homini19 TaxID=3052006 RepID=A0AAU7STF2_9VIRU
MPYYRRRRWQRRRRNWYWPRRARYFVRRRRRWRKRPTVRRKLKKLTIQQWQPKTIRKCCIQGLHCLFLVTEDTISRNYRMYEHSYTGEYYPGGGGYSVTRYSLDGLYEQHQLDRNWWTNSNTNLPLVRYTGCKIKFYQSWSVDYICNYSLTWPMVATQLLYQSCQPSFMMMNKNSIMIPSKLTKPIKKGYKTIRFKPPHEMLNRWYFAKDLSKVGLLMLTAASASFDHYYQATDSLSNNCTFESLNPYFYMRHDFILFPVTGYVLQSTGTIETRLFTTQTIVHETNISTMKPTTAGLTYMGNSKIDTEGNKVIPTNKANYFDNKQNWGNPFNHTVLQVHEHLLISRESLDSLKNIFLNDLEFGTKFQIPANSTHESIRYAPDRDTGVGNKVYLLSVSRDTGTWEPPHDEQLIVQGFPLWSCLYGFVSWQVKLAHITNIYKSYVLVIVSNFLKPQLPYYIPLDDEFIEGKSPYIPDTITQQQLHEHQQNWYPSLQYQLRAIEKIVRTGPGIPKLGGRKSEEAKIFYKFYFKFGGCPPKMDTVNDPTKQEAYPVPGYQPSTYSLQNPTMPQEYYLYQFDEADGILTKRAAKRITAHKKTEKTLFSTTGKMDAQAQETTTDSEEEEDPTFLKIKLRQLRRQRQQLEQQIEQIMTQP